jgi:recombinational DNA repair protein (RecF pathway)
VSEREFLSTVNVLKELSYGDEDTVSLLIRYLVSSLDESGYSLKLSPFCDCGEEIEGRTYFDYRSGTFYCEKCFSGTGREINNDTLKTLLNVMDGKEQVRANTTKVLKLLEYYIENRVEESIGALKELIKIL